MQMMHVQKQLPCDVTLQRQLSRTRFHCRGNVQSSRHQHNFKIPVSVDFWKCSCLVESGSNTVFKVCQTIMSRVTKKGTQTAFFGIIMLDETKNGSAKQQKTKDGFPGYAPVTSYRMDLKCASCFSPILAKCWNWMAKNYKIPNSYSTNVFARLRPKFLTWN